MSTSYPGSKQTFTDPVAGQPTDQAPVADGLDTLGALQDRVGYTNATASRSGSHEAQLAALWAWVDGETMQPYHAVGTAGTNATAICGSACQVGYVAAYNTAGSAYYVKLYDTAGTPSVGTDPPVLTLLVPGGGTAGAGNNLPLPAPVTFATGLGLGLTAGAADSDTGAVGAGQAVVNLGYRV